MTPKKEREAEAHLAKMRQEAEALHAKMRTMTPEELLECAAMLVMTPMRTRAMLATMTPDELREGVAMLTEMHAAYSDAGHKQLEAENGQLTVKLTRLETQIKRLEIEEEEYRRYLVRRALGLMQAEFEPATWKACWEFVVHDRPAAEVAAELGLSVNAVYLAKSRVLRRLRAELRGLLD